MFFGQWSLRKKCFWDILTFSRGSQFQEKTFLCISRTISWLCSFAMNFGLKLFTFLFSEGLNVESSVVQYFHMCLCCFSVVGHFSRKSLVNKAIPIVEFEALCTFLKWLDQIQLHSCNFMIPAPLFFEVNGGYHLQDKS